MIMTEYNDPTFVQREPNVIVHELLQEHWDDSNIDGRFERREPNDPESDSDGRLKWMHTGRYDDDNPNTQITIVSGDEGSESPTGWDGIDPSGAGPVAWVDGVVDVSVWVPSDDYPYDVTGVNPKTHGWQLRLEVDRIISRFAAGTEYNGTRELQRLGIGNVQTLPDPDDTPVEHQRYIPVLYSWFKGREHDDNDNENDDNGEDANGE